MCVFSYMKREPGFYRQVVALAAPIVLQNLITSTLGMADTFMVGMLGETPMAAVTLANIPLFVVQLFIFGVQSGASVLISQYWGKQDMEAINRVLGVALWVVLLVSSAFAAVLVICPQEFLSLFGNQPDVVALAAQYGSIAGISYVCNSFTMMYVAAYRSMEQPALGMYILAASMTVNTCLNWVFIFGNLGAPALGVRGAALATLIARSLEVIIVVTHMTRTKFFRVRAGLLLRPGSSMVRRFLRYGGLVVLNETTWGLGTSVLPTIMGHMEGSTEILAARALAGNIEDLCTVAIFAIGNTTAIIVGREIGAGRREHVYEVGATLDTLAFLCGLIIGIPLILGAWFVFPWLVYPFFHLSETAGSITTMMLTFIGVFLALRAFDSVNTVGVLRGGGDVRAATIIDTTPLWFVSLPLAALFGLVFQWGIFWVYVGIMAEQFVKFGIGLYRLRSREWINDVTQFSRTE